jgi:hypothetical protein
MYIVYGGNQGSIAIAFDLHGQPKKLSLSSSLSPAFSLYMQSGFGGMQLKIQTSPKVTLHVWQVDLNTIAGVL